MTFKPIFAVLLVAVIVAGCTTTSKFASKSRFASVYTSRIATPTGKLTPTFPNGLQRDALAPNKPYFIEFRARSALSYGHASVAFGKLTRDGKVPRRPNGDLKPGKIEISGLHPASDSNLVYSAGHFVPVHASTGPSDGDEEEAYLLARYRINLTHAEFKRTVALIKRRQRRSKFWNGPVSSCVTYLRRVAEDLGLKTPATPHLPKRFVEQLKALNSGK